MKKLKRLPFCVYVAAFTKAGKGLRFKGALP